MSDSYKKRPTAKLLLFSGDRIVTVTGKSGLMNLPGGGIDRADRNPQAALLREVNEELGIEPEHITQPEWHGVLSGKTRQHLGETVMSEWQVFSADLLVPVAELAPNHNEIQSYGDFRRTDLVFHATISELARRAIVSFT